MFRSKINLIIIILLFLSFNMLALGTICYALEDNIENYKYSDTSEYDTITTGLSFIEELPIQFNILNEYFSGFDSLSLENRQSILMAYFIKNQLNTYTCGDGKDICIDKNSLKDEKIKSLFHTDTEFDSNTIKLYLDDYGKHNISSTNSSTFYRVVLDDNSNYYRKYTKFAKYKEQGDMYIFYVYEGYYKSNCQAGETAILYDFITGDEVYIDTSDGKNGFVNPPDKEVEKLQMYKYEFKKDKDGSIYLYGYNPVHSA